MKLMTKLLASGALALGAVAATTAPATAQVQGNVATADVARAIIGTSALQTAYRQISETYANQIQLSQTKQQELSTLLQPFDTNGDRNFSESELAAVSQSPSAAQIQQLEAEVASLTNQVSAARLFAVEQILNQYPAALTDVTTQQNIVVVFQPDTLQFAADGTDITSQVATALNARIPTVSITPPDGWRPTRNAAALFQEIQETLILAQLRQQQQQAQQQTQQPATQAPAGR